MNNRKIIFAGLLVVLIALLGTDWTPGFQWKPGVQVYTLTIDETKIIVEIADTDMTRAQGLSNRPALEKNRGVLFVFDTADYRSFWMKEMRFPLDIIWLDDNWRVIDLTENISEKDFPKTYQPRSPARYVLEVNAGFISAHQIMVGAQASFTK